MEDINELYHNDFGIAFQWKRCAAKDYKKIQLVFRNTGLFLSEKELLQFNNYVENTLKKPSVCIDCKENDNCKSLLLETPAPQISLAVSSIELKYIKDLLKGTLAQLELESIFRDNAIIKKK